MHIQQECTHQLLVDILPLKLDKLAGLNLAEQLQPGLVHGSLQQFQVTLTFLDLLTCSPHLLSLTGDLEVWKCRGVD